MRTLVCALKGTPRQFLSFARKEGEVNSMNSNGSSMVIGSTEGYVKVFDISRRYLLWCWMSMIIVDPIRFDREPWRLGKTLNINAYVPPVDSIRERAVNCNGSKVTVLATQVRRRDNLSFQAMSCCFIASLDQLESEQSIVSLECQERSGEELRFGDQASTRHRIWSHSKERQPRQECFTVSSLSIDRTCIGIQKTLDWWHWSSIYFSRNWTWQHRWTTMSRPMICFSPAEVLAMKIRRLPLQSQLEIRQCPIRKK